MEYSCVQLDDLPEEILMIIFKNLDNVAVLYSLVGVNERLNKIVLDSLFTRDLTLMRYASNNSVYPLPDQIVNRFCLEILPKIHHKIEYLKLESSSMGRILLPTNYPNLSGLGLFNIQAKRATHIFCDETLFTCTFKNQISSLVIDINTKGEQTAIRDVNALVFTHILTTFTNLRLLHLNPHSIWFQYLSFDISPPTVISSTLLELYVCLENFSDCLYLLDGRLNQLRTFHVNIDFICSSRLIINNKEKLPNLRSFTLHCNMRTDFYNELILPLLHRMSNLEKLDLSLLVWVKKNFLDGNDLKLNILNDMPLLNKFTFNIRSFSRFYNEINFPCNETIQHTFKDFHNQQIISSIDYFQKSKYSLCHTYLYPYKWKHYDYLTNNFPGGLFKCVREVQLFDEHPFEHEFFRRIEKSFPLLEKLTIINRKGQKNKRFQKSKYENRDLSIIQYPCLIHLDLTEAHQDYHEQFLFDTKTCLPNHLHVCMNYQLVKKVTRNFRRNTTRSNCAKISYLYFTNRSQFPEHLKDYFPKVNRS